MHLRYLAGVSETVTPYYKDVVEAAFEKLKSGELKKRSEVLKQISQHILTLHP